MQANATGIAASATILLLAAGAALSTFAASAQEFPTRPVRIVVPSATPAGAVARLNGETVRVLGLPDVRDNLRAQGLMAVTGTPEQFAALIKSDTVRYNGIARAANVRLD